MSPRLGLYHMPYHGAVMVVQYWHRIERYLDLESIMLNRFGTDNSLPEMT